MALTRGKRLGFIALAMLLGSSVGLVLTEGFFRLMGRRPWEYVGGGAHEPTMHDPDPVLGWHPRPGQYHIPAYSAWATDVRFTIQPDGTRATGGNGNGAPDVAFVGCSMTQGWAISDEETFAWRIQQRFPSVGVANYGIGAYGTYQALLIMERLLSSPSPPRLIVYGFIDEHESRNVAHPNWLRTLSFASKGGMVATPYCTLDAKGSLVRHPPEGYPAWPLQTRSALVASLASLYADRRGAGRIAQAGPVTEQLVLEMNRLAQRSGVGFLVVFLHVTPPAKARYLKLLSANHVDVLDCDLVLTRNLKVRGDGHPNGAANARWAECIAGRLAKMIPAWR